MRQILIPFLAVAAVGVFFMAEGQGLHIPVVGQDPCMSGPAYWCKNLTTASQCNMTDECKNGSWKNMPMEEVMLRDDDDDSDPCKKGPSYWCQNIKTVMECDAQAYCKFGL